MINKTDNFIEITIGENTPEKSVPIPVRSFNEQRLAYNDTSHYFLEQAKKYENHSEKSAFFVPFMCYWPTYGMMSYTQQKWYFYWRNSVRHDNFIKTDLSYIFIYIYELINGIGTKDAKDGFNKLFQLWKSYRPQFPKLDRYMVFWLMDYVIIYDCPKDSTEMLLSFMKDNNISCPVDIILSNFHESISNISLSYIKKLLDYNIEKSSFYNKDENHYMDTILPDIINVLDKYHIKKYNKSMLLYYMPEDKEILERSPFENAIYAGKKDINITLEIIPFSNHYPLKCFLTSSVKYSENLLRTYTGFSGRLHGINLSQDIKKLLQGFIEHKLKEKSPKNKINVDNSRIQQLIKDSEVLKNRLLLQENSEEKVTSPSTQFFPEPSLSPLAEQKTASAHDTSFHVDSDMSLFLSKLDKIHLDIIKAVLQNNCTINAKDLTKQFPQIFIEPFIDAINSLGIDFLGDILILEEKDNKLISEEYRQDLIDNLIS